MIILIFTEKSLGKVFLIFSVKGRYIQKSVNMPLEILLCLDVFRRKAIRSYVDNIVNEKAI